MQRITEESLKITASVVGPTLSPETMLPTSSKLNLNKIKSPEICYRRLCDNRSASDLLTVYKICTFTKVCFSGWNQLWTMNVRSYLYQQ